MNLTDKNIDRDCFIQLVNNGRKRKIKGNEYIFFDDCVIGKTSNNEKCFIIDKEDYDYAKYFTWYQNTDGYITTVINQKDISIRLYLHILVMNAINSDKIIDHINNKKQDNRKQNLRFVTYTENRMNIPVSQNKKSKLPKGITLKDGKYQVRIGYMNKQLYLGRYTNLEEAVKVYNDKAEELYKEYAYRG